VFHSTTTKEEENNMSASTASNNQNHHHPYTAAAATADDDDDDSNQYVTSWEPKVAQEIISQMKQQEEHQQEQHSPVRRRRPFMVALVGIPGSGKSMSASILSECLHTTWGISSMIMPHDGYHYPLDVLQQWEQQHGTKQGIVYRRGAPDTFDAPALERDLRRIVYGTESCIELPGFDHAVGDPQPKRHRFDRNVHEIVICEGLYLLHNADGWQNIASMWDYSIFIDADVDICMERLTGTFVLYKYAVVLRCGRVLIQLTISMIPSIHSQIFFFIFKPVRNQCIPGYTKEEIAKRVQIVDRSNAKGVLQCNARADVVVQSIAATTNE
jgi:pantothenate kinase